MIAREEMVSIVVIDDDPLVTTLLKEILAHEGYQVITAQHAVEGLHHLKSTTVNLVITDLLMPGKDGLETITELRQFYPQTKILAISGGMTNSGMDILEIAKRLGANGVLQKPFDVQDLINSVRSVLNT